MDCALVGEAEIRHFHLFCGEGGGALGFNRGEARVGSLRAKAVCIGGIDNNPRRVRGFTRHAGVPGTLLDLFSREQYTAFHGHEPPADWREATINDIRRAAHGKRPHVVFFSAPCKGFSGLLPEHSSKTAKYRALNELTIRALWLTLEAFGDDPPEFFIFENVPRIMTRGRPMIDQMFQLLRSFDYAAVESTHDCGELGGLAQSRKRFLMLSRHQKKVPPFLYEPPKRRLRGVGEVLGVMALPGDPRAGPMHRMPQLQFKTWLRLAFVEAGSDWRSLNKLRVVDGHLADFGLMPERHWHHGVFGVHRWEDYSGAVTTRSGPTNGAHAVADPRFESSADYHQYGVRPWSRHVGAIINVKSPGQGQFAVADPRMGDTGPRFNNVYRIVGWGNHAQSVTAGGHPTAGGQAVADIRCAAGFAGGKYRVTKLSEAAGTVIGASTTGNGAFAVADPLPTSGFPGAYGVLDGAETARTVKGESLPSNGPFAVADPRCTWGADSHRNKLKVNPWGGPSNTVSGSQQVGSGAPSVADPRPAFQTGGHYGVLRWLDHSGVVTGSGQHDNGPWSVADPRPIDGDAAPEELPAPDDRMVAVIRALDGTWHRPFTTLELAALQGLYDPEQDEPLVLDGNSDADWREAIGNLVPPPAAQAIASEIYRTLLLAWTGETFMLSATPIWVRNVAMALSIDVGAPVL